MIKILIGGSPCTHWSIAQKNNRETEAEGIGWELFRNYLIAKEKFKPDYFLYENNKSAAQPIKDQISAELGAPLQYINSALVSAQNRQRFYCHNIPNVPQPEDRGILLRDVLESGAAYNEKSYCLTATEWKGSSLEHNLQKHVRTQIAEPIRIGDPPNEAGEISGSQATRIYSIDGKSVNLVANGGGQGAKTGLYACPVAVDLQVVGRKRNEDGDFERSWEARTDGKSSALTSIESRRMVACPVGTPAILRYERTEEAKRLRKAYEAGEISHGFHEYHELHPREDGKSNTISTVHEVRDGKITIKGKQYPIKLLDGYYIIRKLTVTECCRLQTMPDNYCRAVSNTQAYKGLGNGWTAEVIIHILKHANIPLNEEILVLSMYDGIGTGRYCFDKMGYTNVTYHAYEIDKYAMQISASNYPGIIQHGDAFQVREDAWNIENGSHLRQQTEAIA